MSPLRDRGYPASYPETPSILPLDLWLAFAKPTKGACADSPFLPTGHSSGANCQVTWLSQRTRRYLDLPTWVQEDQQLLAPTSPLDFLLAMPAPESPDDERARAGSTETQSLKFLPPQV